MRVIPSPESIERIILELSEVEAALPPLLQRKMGLLAELRELRENLVQTIAGDQHRVDRITRLIDQFGEGSPKEDPILHQSINTLEFTTRSSVCMKTEQIYTIGDLLKRTERELLSIPNLGRISLNQIKEVLASRGLRLKEA